MLMAAISQQYWGVGPHWLYHGLGNEVVVGVYDQMSGEVIEGCIVKIMWGNVEVMLPANAGPQGCRVVVVG